MAITVLDPHVQRVQTKLSDLFHINSLLQANCQWHGIKRNNLGNITTLYFCNFGLFRFNCMVTKYPLFEWHVFESFSISKVFSCKEIIRP